MEGRIYDVEWPVYWHVNSDRVNIFQGRQDSFTNVDLLWADDVGANVPVVRAKWKDPMLSVDREGALRILRQEMWTHAHFGHVPGDSEVCPPDFQAPSTAPLAEFVPDSSLPPVSAETPSVVPRTAEGVTSDKLGGHKSPGRYRKPALPEVVVSPPVTPLPAGRYRRRRGRSPVAAAATPSHIDKWIIDTGCGYDLVQLDDVLRRKATRRPCIGEPVRLDTANGLVEIKEQVALLVPEINEEVRACVLDATPAVLSVGRRCMDHGYAFHWEPGCNPILVCPGGDRVLHLDIEHYVPFLVRGTEAQPAMAAAVEGGASSSSGPSGDAAPECALAVEDVVGEVEESDPPGRDLKAEAVSREHLMTHMHKQQVVSGVSAC
jgi:hypothetical protein